MDIVFFVSYEDENEGLTIVMNENKTVREMILRVFHKLDIDCNGYLEKYCILFGQKLISSKENLDKTLKEIGLKSNRRLKVIKTDDLVPT